MKMYVYLLKDPMTNAVRYVGQTKSPDKRLKSHMSPSTSLYRKNYPFYQFLFNLVGNKTPLIMDVVETTDRSHVGFLEQVWIHKMLDDGCELFNQRVMPRVKLDRRIKEQQK